MVGTPFLLSQIDLAGALVFGLTFGSWNTDAARCMAATGDGGYILGGDTFSYGVGQHDALFLKVGPEVIYHDCVEDCTPTVMTPDLTVMDVSGYVDYTPSVTSVSPSVDTLDLAVEDACTPWAVMERDIRPSRTSMRVFPIVGGLRFETVLFGHV
jgi:hypothetical protein